ncbi:hypothetical protein EZV62_006961 [Acer yangbiense]|uniref:Uncharacterized protein n=1 Tax=Acer yangbiense TaxID=1000413 RepID=A0A5C7IBA5_9ROSI|nr:hypothetical protein EZV62_006961 [Acer yangbiense]
MDKSDDACTDIKSLATCLSGEITRDIWSVENQIPFFILEDLFKSVKTRDLDECYDGLSISKLVSLFCDNICELLSIDKTLFETKFSGAKHFVDLLRLCIELADRQLVIEIDTMHTPTLPTITELHLAGIKFEVGSNKPLFDIRFDKIKGTLEIPKLRISYISPYFRNLQMFEALYCETNYVNDYAILLGQLVSSPKDAELLILNGILENTESVDPSTFCGEIGKQARGKYKRFYYKDLARDLNAYCKSPWHKQNANLKQNYFNTPWASISVIAAALLLLLTITQTVGKNGVKNEGVNIDSNGSTDVGRADSFSFGGSLIQRSFAEVVNGSQMGLHENAGVQEGNDRDGGAVRCQSTQSSIAARIDKGYPTFQSFQRKGYGKNVEGGSDVRGLPPKVVAFQNSKEVIWRMEGQHANLASDGETCSFSSESDIRGLWKGECSSKNRAMWLRKFGHVDKSVGLSLDFESLKAKVSKRDMGNVVSPYAKMPKMDTGNVDHKKTTGLVVDLIVDQAIDYQLDQTSSFLQENQVGVPLDDKTSSSPIENRCSMEDNSPRKCSVQSDSRQILRREKAQRNAYHPNATVCEPEIQRLARPRIIILS